MISSPWKIFLLVLPLSTLHFPLSISYALTQQESLEWLLLREDYETLSVRAENLTKSYPRSEYFYLAGLAHLKSSNFEKARRHFLKVTQKHRRSPEFEKALIGIADSFYIEGKIEEALKNYLAIQKKYPQSPSRSYILYRLGQCFRSLGNTSQAGLYFDRVIAETPRAAEAKLARIRREETPFFTVQVGAFIDPQNAGRMERMVRSKGFPSYIAESNEGRLTLYRVRVGQFKTEKEARELEARLRQQGFDTKIFP